MRGDRLEPLYLVALSTGLRQGELLGLRWDDLDLPQGTLAVPRSLQRVSGQVTFVEPKTARSRRTVVMSETAAATLRQQWAQQASECRRAGPRWHEEGVLFTTAMGRPLDGMNVTHRFQKLLDRAGLARRRFHDLRHSCATALLAQGGARARCDGDPLGTRRSR
jgi:integrase